jgi:hypothetical protein
MPLLNKKNLQKANVTILDDAVLVMRSLFKIENLFGLSLELCSLILQSSQVLIGDIFFL